MNFPQLYLLRYNKAMKRKGFLIGEVSTLFGISVDTLRYYDKIKLFSPSFVDENSYRYYSIADIRRLRFIIFGKQMDLSIDVIRQLFNKGNVDKLESILKERKQHVMKQIKNLRELSSQIDHTLEFIDDLKEDHVQFSIKTLPQRFFNTVKSDVRYQTDEESFIELYDALLEYPYSSGISQYLLNRLGETVKMSEDWQRDFGFYSDTAVSKDSVKIPAGKYAVLRLNNSEWERMGDDHYTLLKWLENKNLKGGDKAYTVWKINDEISSDYKDYRLELQIPII